MGPKDGIFLFKHYVSFQNSKQVCSGDIQKIWHMALFHWALVFSNWIALEGILKHCQIGAHELNERINEWRFEKKISVPYERLYYTNL